MRDEGRVQRRQLLQDLLLTLLQESELHALRSLRRLQEGELLALRSLRCLQLQVTRLQGVRWPLEDSVHGF